MEHLSEEGIAARGDTGEGDPVQAIQDRFGIPVDRVSVSRTAG